MTPTPEEDEAEIKALVASVSSACSQLELQGHVKEGSHLIFALLVTAARALQMRGDPYGVWERALGEAWQFASVRYPKARLTRLGLIMEAGAENKPSPDHLLAPSPRPDGDDPHKHLPKPDNDA